MRGHGFATAEKTRHRLLTSEGEGQARAFSDTSKLTEFCQNRPEAQSLKVVSFCFFTECAERFPNFMFAPSGASPQGGRSQTAVVGCASVKRSHYSDFDWSRLSLVCSSLPPLGLHCRRNALAICFTPKTLAAFKGTYFSCTSRGAISCEMSTGSVDFFLMLAVKRNTACEVS